MKKTILIVLVAMLMLNGCTAKPINAKVALANTIDSILKQDFDTARKTTIYSDYVNKFYAAFEDAKEDDQLNKELFKKVSYEITSEKKESDTVYLYQVKVVSPNLEKIFNKVFQEFFMANLDKNKEIKTMDDVINDYIPKALNSDDLEMKTYDNIIVTVVKDDGNWEVDITKDLINPLTGGMYSMIENSLEMAPN